MAHVESPSRRQSTMPRLRHRLRSRRKQRGKSAECTADADPETQKLQKELFSAMCMKEEKQKEDINHLTLMKFLFKWKNSAYSLIWVDLMAWIGAYIILNTSYRLMPQYVQAGFIRLVLSINTWQSSLPVTFLLGFFVNNVMGRWWRAYLEIPTMRSVCLTLHACISDGEEPKKAAKFRSCIARYLILAYILGFWKISSKLQARFAALRQLVAQFNRTHESSAAAAGSSSAVNDGNLNLYENCRVPTASHLYPAIRSIGQTDLSPADIAKIRMAHNHEPLDKIDEDDPEVAVIVDSVTQKLVLINQDPVVREAFGELITPSEIAVFQEIARKSCSDSCLSNFALPLHWATALAERAHSEGHCKTDGNFEEINSCIRKWGSKLSMCGKFAKRNLPLVYAQVVIIAVYTWFFAELLSAQMVKLDHLYPDGSKPVSPIKLKLSPRYYSDYYVPILSLLKVVFIMGWFKVAMVVLDPFGTDKEDLPISQLLTENLHKARDFCKIADMAMPKKLKTKNADCFDSDEGEHQEMARKRRGPWRETKNLQDFHNGAGRFSNVALDLV